jgi:type II secretory pathway pseudopilin PulG
MLCRRYRRQQAFTLLELLTVSVLLLLLVGLIFPSWAKIWNTWLYQREHLRILEEVERLFQRIYEDGEHMALNLDQEADDLQVLENGQGMIFPSRCHDGTREYILWQWVASSSKTIPADGHIYRSRLQEYSEEAKALCESHTLNAVAYRSFRNMFPEHTTETAVLPKDLFMKEVVSWHIRYVSEVGMAVANEGSGHATASSDNMLVYEDFSSFFSWRAWLQGDLALGRTPKWLAITIAVLPSSLHRQWEQLSSGNRESFLQQHGLFRTKLLPFPKINGV